MVIENGQLLNILPIEDVGAFSIASPRLPSGLHKQTSFLRSKNTQQK